MKKISSLLVSLSMAGLLSAGESEKAAVQAADLSIAAAPAAVAPVPAPAPASTLSAKEWVEVVKSVYYAAFEGKTLDKLPSATASELPKPVLQQLIKDLNVVGSDYPSEVYKLIVAGKTAFVVQNYNSVDTWVTIFDATGRRIASGGTDADTFFSWDMTAAEKWLQTVKETYAEGGISGGMSGFKEHKLVSKADYAGLPKSVVKRTEEYRKECLDMQIGTPINIRVYKFTMDGKSGIIVQCRFDEYTFASLFDPSGKLLADGSADSSEFGWNSDESAARSVKSDKAVSSRGNNWRHSDGWNSPPVRQTWGGNDWKHSDGYGGRW